MTYCRSPEHTHNSKQLNYEQTRHRALPVEHSTLGYTCLLFFTSHQRVCICVWECLYDVKFNLYLVLIEFLLLLQMSLQPLGCRLGLTQILLQPLRKNTHYARQHRGYKQAKILPDSQHISVMVPARCSDCRNMWIRKCVRTSTCMWSDRIHVSWHHHHICMSCCGNDVGVCNSICWWRGFPTLDARSIISLSKQSLCQSCGADKFIPAWLSRLLFSALSSIPLHS